MLREQLKQKKRQKHEDDSDNPQSRIITSASATTNDMGSDDCSTRHEISIKNLYLKQFQVNEKNCTPFSRACEREAAIKQVNHRHALSTYKKNVNLKRYQPYLCKGYFIFLFVSSQTTMVSLIVDSEFL